MDCDYAIADDLELMEHSRITEEETVQTDEDKENYDVETLKKKHDRIKTYCGLYFNQPEFIGDNVTKTRVHMKYKDEQIGLFIDLIAAGSDVRSAC